MGHILEAVKSFQESIEHHPLADVVLSNSLKEVYEAIGWKREAEFVGKLKEDMEPIVLTERNERIVYELCEACDRSSLEGSLWTIHDLQRVCTSV